MKSTDTALIRPVKIGILFSAFTVVLFEFGVYEWDVPNKFWFYLFLIACNIAMYYGFRVGVNKEVKYPINKQININRINVVKIRGSRRRNVDVLRWEVCFFDFYNHGLLQDRFSVEYFITTSKEMYVSDNEISE